MRKLQKAAVAAAMVGTLSLIASGTATAQPSYGHGHEGGHCKSHDFNIDILGEVGILNGLLGNALNGEGNAGGQVTDFGGTC